MVYIRVDANQKVGIGHVMRCLSIAVEMQRLMEDVVFLIADECTKKMITAYGFSVICLDGQWDNMESELNALLELIIEQDVHQLLIDSYYVTEYYLNVLHQYVRLIYIDDIAAFPYPVDLLINYNIFANKKKYQKLYGDTDRKPEFLLGCEYVPLRAEFRDIYQKKNVGHEWNDCDKNSINSKIKKILITSGGTDNNNVLSSLLCQLKEKEWFNTIECHVVIGEFYLFKSKLLQQWSDCPNVFLYENVSNMSTYMSMCDIAVTAGGSTVYELCACGVPAVMYTLADNQFGIAHEFDSIGLIHWCGDIRKNKTSCIEHVIAQLEMMLWNEDVLKEKSNTLHSMIDGYGAVRIAQRLSCRKFETE